MFDNFETVLKIQWVNEHKHSALVYFEDIVSAVRVVSFCNFNLVNGKILKINFVDEDNLR